MSDASYSAAYGRVAPLTIAPEQPEVFTELPVWDPVFGVETPWQELLNEQLGAVLRNWLHGKGFSRKNRRDYQKLNLSVRTGEVPVAAEPPLQL
jgi:hypothetical protein